MLSVLRRKCAVSQGNFSRLLVLIPALLLFSPPSCAATASENEQCEHEQTGKAASSLLQVDAHNSRKEDHFGPGRCVGVRKSVAGQCVFRTRCKGLNISQTEFAFVCFNPGASMPHALHSFGRGGFSLDETFDTGVRCKTCTSVDTAFRTGSGVVRNALAALPLGRLPSLNGGVTAGAAYSAQELTSFKPKEAAVFGPSYCISTFRAPAGTCLIRTRCKDIDLTKFNVGVTCLDKSAGYTRYLFGKDTFKSEETFDTLITCEKCLGVGPEASLYAMHGLLPRKLVEDVNTLKLNVQTLTEKVRVLQQSGSSNQGSRQESHPLPPMPSHPSNRNVQKPQKHRSHQEHDPMGPMPGHPNSQRQLAADSAVAEGGAASDSTAQEAESPMPTVMMSRVMEEHSGAESAAVDVGSVEVVSHRRGAAIMDLLRRVSEGVPPSPAGDEIDGPMGGRGEAA